MKNSLHIGISIVVQQKLYHLLVTCACTVEQSSPASRVLQLQLRTLLLGQEEKPLYIV